MTKPFQTKRALITCSCGNNGLIVTEYYGVTLAKLSLHCCKQRLFNPTWKLINDRPDIHPISEKDQVLMNHLKQGHKLKVYVP